MTDLVSLVLVLVVGYLLGAIPFGYVVARAKGIDIFAHGSGNIGATNVGRVLGRKYGILVFVLDLAKGAIPAAAAGYLGGRLETTLPAYGLDVGAGLAAFLGHLFPVYLGFRGGKGVATAAGVILVLLPGPAGGALLIWLGVVLATSYVSLASVSAAAGLVGLRLWLTPEPFGRDQIVLTGFCLIAALLVLVRHHANLSRLARGTENRLKESPAMVTLGKTIHVLALGFWFGMAVFFTFVVALNLFGAFETEAAKPASERPLWFPLPKEFDQDAAARKDQGTRAAGFAISPLFAWYFPLQGLCGFLAAATALGWPRLAPAERVHRVRAGLLILGLLLVVIGYPVERQVSQLRVERGQAMDAVLRLQGTAPEAIQTTAAELRSAFGTWHGYSVLLNLGTVFVVTVAMALAAQLPCPRETPAPGGS